MGRNVNRYGLDTVEEYMDKNGYWDIAEVIEGVLLDNIIIWHDSGIVEVFEEVYQNCWSSAYIRHIYRKGLPKKWERALEEEYARLEREENETAYFEALQSGAFDIIEATI